MFYRPKTEIALEQYDRAVINGVVFDWFTFDAPQYPLCVFAALRERRHLAILSRARGESNEKIRCAEVLAKPWWAKGISVVGFVI